VDKRRKEIILTYIDININKGTIALTYTLICSEKYIEPRSGGIGEMNGMRTGFKEAGRLRVLTSSKFI